LPDENAIVVPQGDVDSMVAAIARLAHERPRLGLLKRAARSRVAVDFAPGLHFARLEGIIDECFQQPRPHPAVEADATAGVVAGLVRCVKEVAGLRPVVVYGAGMFGRKVVDALLEAGVPVSALVDSDPARSGSVYRGLRCESPGSLAKMMESVFVVGSMAFAREIADRIRSAAGVEGGNPTIIGSGI
jgi:hypothetical protein